MGMVPCTALVCDVCSHRWLQQGGKLPERCPRRACRSSKWNSGRQATAPEPTASEQRAPAKPKPAPKADKPQAASKEVTRCSHGLLYHPACTD